MAKGDKRCACGLMFTPTVEAPSYCDFCMRFPELRVVRIRPKFSKHPKQAAYEKTYRQRIAAQRKARLKARRKRETA